VFLYRLHWADGEEAGEAAYAADIPPGEVILTSDGGRIRRLRVLDHVPLEEQSPYDALLTVEAAR
jgi:hypothetical protein